jgi:hypothetical protein
VVRYVSDVEECGEEKLSRTGDAKCGVCMLKNRVQSWTFGCYVAYAIRRRISNCFNDRGSRWGVREERVSGLRCEIVGKMSAAEEMF